MKSRINLLLDIEATLTLIKGNLKGETLIQEKPMALTDVTGHQVKTIEKVRAKMRLDDKEIRHIMHIVRNFCRLRRNSRNGFSSKAQN